MSRTLNLLYLFGTFAILFVNYAEARRARIIGGEFAVEGQFPHQVAVRFLNKGPCGGSILTERFIITAAHCIINDDNKITHGLLEVIAGSANLLSTPESRVVVDVIKVYIPFEFNPTVWKMRDDFPGDIAILELRYNLDIAGNSKLGRVKLPKVNEANYEGKKAIISGFGHSEVRQVVDKTTGQFVEKTIQNDYKLRFAEANVMSNSDCEKRYGGRTRIPAYDLCAALVQRNVNQPEGVCSGDSGSGLIYNETIIGIVNTSPHGCRENVKPAVYTRVSHYLSFISNVLASAIGDNIRTTTSGMTDDTYKGDRLSYRVFLENNGGYFCGGSILDERFVITAAHCFGDLGTFVNTSLKVVAVISDLNSKSISKIIIDVAEVHVPGEFYHVVLNKRDEPTGDIAIIELKHGFDFKRNSGLGKVKLPENNENNYETKIATIYGSSFREVNLVDGKNVYRLQLAEVNITINDDCQNIYGVSLRLNAKHLCAAVIQQDKKIPVICKGDLGSGVVYNDTIIGIASTNPHGCYVYPATYTRVSQYLSFINNVMLNGTVNDNIPTNTSGREESNIYDLTYDEYDPLLYQISLEANGKYICGGSILSERFVVTSAYCVTDNDNRFTNQTLTVVAVMRNLKLRSTTRLNVDVVKVYVPKDFKGIPSPSQRSITGDIAILELKNDFEFEGNSNPGKVKLPENNESNYEGKNVTIVQSYLTKVKLVNDKKVYRLRLSEANITSNPICERRYGGHIPVNAEHLCVTRVRRDKSIPADICRADLGSGLIYNGSIIGIASFLPVGCTADVMPTVYTRVSYYLSFINNVLNGTIDDNVHTVSFRVKDSTYENTYEGELLPSQVFLERDGEYFCGGNILSERYVITAAQCFDHWERLVNKSLKVVARINTLESRSESRIAVDFATVYIPGEYYEVILDKRDKSTGDIAILKLKNDLDFKHNTQIGRAKLPGNNDTDYKGNNATISGTAYREVDIVNKKRIFRLRLAEVNVTSNDDCEHEYGDTFRLTTKHLCAGLVQHDANIPLSLCKADRGSGLIYEGTIIGVVSSNPKGCHKNVKPSVYTKVSHFLSFINNVLNDTIDWDTTATIYF